ncbi:MAG: hypothetical protein ABSF48_25440, partial [Thermodesulfobacteriota bacterium]
PSSHEDDWQKDHPSSFFHAFISHSPLAQKSLSNLRLIKSINPFFCQAFFPMIQSRREYFEVCPLGAKDGMIRIKNSYQK